MSTDETDTVLELRIHGVNNTPPHQMLDVPNEDVARAFGDDLGSFWQLTPEAVEQGRTDRVQGVSRGVVDPSEPPRGRVPSGIHREAYSWGGMVRTTPPDTSFGGKIVAGVARAAWTFLLPFSIANAAIWSWRLPSPAGGTKIRYGSGMIRVACLTLTVIFVLAIASVGIDLLALQCFRGRATVCPPLSETLEVFAAWKDERRVALFSLLPIVALLVVYFVSTVTTLRYNVAGRILTTEADTVERPLLAEPRFWQSRRETHRLALLHLTAGVATVALLLSFSFASISMLTGLFLAGAAIVVLLIAAGLTALTDSTPYERIEAAPRLPGFMLGLAVALYALPALVLGFHGEIRLVPRYIGAASDLVLVAVIVIALVLIAMAWLLPAPRRAERAWNGHGAAVFLTIGLAISLILAALVNVIVGDWLNGPAAANRLDQPYPVCNGANCSPREITVGTFYAPFLGITLVAVIVALIVLAAMAVRRRNVGGRAPSSTTPSNPPSPRDLLAGLLGGEIEKKRALAARLHLAEPIVGILAVAFFVAIVATLLLPYVLQAVIVLGPAVPQFIESLLGTGLARWIDASLGVWVVIGLLIAAGLIFGGAKSVRPLALIWDLACFLPRAGHPFGAPCYTERAVPEVTRRISWWLDPETPPESGPAEKATPEPNATAEATPEPTATAVTPHAPLPEATPDTPARRVILSAHSMGAVVAVAALFALTNDPRWDQYRDRVSLLTFGIQLRPYFGRFFPEILGPDVIDCTPCGRPRVWARDPWAAADLGRSDPADAAKRGVPAHTWISLWRLTDYLGFPVQANSADGNARDRYAEEIDAGGYVAAVDTHGWYYRTPTYHAVLDELRTAATDRS